MVLTNFFRADTIILEFYFSKPSHYHVCVQNPSSRCSLPNILITYGSFFETFWMCTCNGTCYEFVSYVIQYFAITRLRDLSVFCTECCFVSFVTVVGITHFLLHSRSNESTLQKYILLVVVCKVDVLHTRDTLRVNWDQRADLFRAPSCLFGFPWNSMKSVENQHPASG